MAISFVNGYVCTSCSDVSKAKQGENPHPTTDATKNAAQRRDQERCPEERCGLGRQPTDAPPRSAARRPLMA
jgi:hypothetical protein